jgi:hypothetical protein
VTPNVSINKSLLLDEISKTPPEIIFFSLEFVHPRHPDDHVHSQAAKYIYGAS